MSKRISRSAFLKGAGALFWSLTSGNWLAGCSNRFSFPVRWLGPSMALGHAIRDRTLTPYKGKPEEKKTIYIIGGGIAGLSAGWWLKRNGFDDFQIFELENNVGGNSSSGQNDVSKYPRGAHYVPIPNEESQYVREFFQEIGVIKGFAQDGKAVYDELYLCHDPQERLFKDGSFQEGLVPHKGLQSEDKIQTERFFKIIEELRSAKGLDGKPAFAIPVDLSSNDAKYKKLDQISMADWLLHNEFDSKPLLWYVEYCCKDDYGAIPDIVSAWAGLHYFAGRRGKAANGEHNTVVTWPEGNGFLVEKLREKLKDHLKTGEMVTQISNEEGGLKISTQAGDSKKAYQCEYAIFASPRFLADYLVKDYPKNLPGSSSNKNSLSYSPWIVANITLSRIPPSRGVQPAWDNVSYYSESLGYVNATHQNISTRSSKTVITYYLPLSSFEPKAGRMKLYTDDQKKWLKHIIADLDKMHPDIQTYIKEVELWPWGHGMIRPIVGYVWGEDRKLMQQNVGNIYFAHSDMSGISNFEEAQYQGIKAAGHIMDKLGHKPG
ncbi:MAG: FAD-dependent oxidoreductase [Candidatus Melainabacteria bacterium]|nr:FAD-dependent oxidoreductase [Candidatus Melainabacteria bacterium]